MFSFHYVWFTLLELNVLNQLCLCDYTHVRQCLNICCWWLVFLIELVNLLIPFFNKYETKFASQKLQEQWKFHFWNWIFEAMLVLIHLDKQKTLVIGVPRFAGNELHLSVLKGCLSQLTCDPQGSCLLNNEWLLGYKSVHILWWGTVSKHNIHFFFYPISDVFLPV